VLAPVSRRVLKQVDSYQQYLIDRLKPKYLREFETPFHNITAIGNV